MKSSLLVFVLVVDGISFDCKRSSLFDRKGFDWAIVRWICSSRSNDIRRQSYLSPFYLFWFNQTIPLFRENWIYQILSWLASTRMMNAKNKKINRGDKKKKEKTLLFLCTSRILNRSDFFFSVLFSLSFSLSQFCCCQNDGKI